MIDKEKFINLPRKSYPVKNFIEQTLMHDYRKMLKSYKEPKQLTSNMTMNTLFKRANAATKLSSKFDLKSKLLATENRSMTLTENYDANSESCFSFSKIQKSDEDSI